jgi:nitrilase
LAKAGASPDSISVASKIEFPTGTAKHIRRGAYPHDYDCALGNDPQTVLMRGGSAIVDPLGQVLAGSDFSGETILYADIDLDDVARGKFDFDASGHYARPDVFQLVVDDRPKAAVSTVSRASAAAGS